MSSVWDTILQWGSTIKVSIEQLPVATRHSRDMTEKLLKATLNPNTHTHTHTHTHFVGFVMSRLIWIYFLNLHCCSQGIFPIDVGGWLLGGGGGGAVSRDGGGTPAIQIEQYFLQAMVRHHSCINNCKHSCLKLNIEIHVQIWNSRAVWTWFLLKNPQSRTLLVYMKFKK